MWADFSGKAFTREQFARRIAQLEWKSWKPIGITLHNTAAPTLAQWAESGPAHDAPIRNLQSYYEGMGWHGGPHWFISRNWLNEFSNPLRRGTHSPSFNATHFGIEMVGDFSREEFDSGDGAKVRDNAVFAMAVLCRRFGWDPAKVIVLHKEDPRTDHDCPGRKVSKAAVIARVEADLARLTSAREDIRRGGISREDGVSTPDAVLTPDARKRPGVSEPSPVAPAPASGGDRRRQQEGVHARLRRAMARAILSYEARRDGKGHLAVYPLPSGDGGGSYEVAGINDGYHPKEARELAALIKAGEYAQAERRAEDFIATFTDAVQGWLLASEDARERADPDPGVEFFLRDCCFNRGPKGAARILQRAAGVADDGIIGAATRRAVEPLTASELLTRLRAAREQYERDVAHRDESSKFWRGLVSRWDKALAQARKFSASGRLRPSSRAMAKPRKPVAPVKKLGWGAGVVAAIGAAAHWIDGHPLLTIGAVVIAALVVLVVVSNMKGGD